MNDYFPVVEEALKTFLGVSLSEEQSQSLAKNLGIAPGERRKMQNNLGTIVLLWMGGSGIWEVGELVEALVCTKSLGRHTTLLCSEQGMVGRGAVNEGWGLGVHRVSGEAHHCTVQCARYGVGGAVEFGEWRGSEIWEVGEPVEALVCTKSLGRHTTVLYSEQGMVGRGEGGGQWNLGSGGTGGGPGASGEAHIRCVCWDFNDRNCRLPHARPSFTAIAWFLCSLPAISHASRAFVVEHVSSTYLPTIIWVTQVMHFIPPSWLLPLDSPATVIWEM